MKRQHEIEIGVAALLGIVGAAAIDSARRADEPTPPADTRQLELCETLANPEYLILEAGDWRRLTGMKADAILTYVYERCPEYLDRVR